MSYYNFFSHEQLMQPLDVVCIENALVDMLVRANDTNLQTFGMKKGVMQLVELETQQQVLKNLGAIQPEIELGGSASNAARGMAILGGNVSYSSSVGNDAHGHAFAQRLEALKIKNALVQITGATTGTCLVVVTPDGERTLNTHLGACRLYTKHHVPYEDIKQAKLFFSTGYMLDTQEQIDALQAAIDFALLHNVKVAFDVADPFVIVRHGKETILKWIEKTHLVFANNQEAQMLLGKQGKEAAQELGMRVQIAIVKDGENGAWLCHDEKVTHIPTQKIKAVDTTGAGDMFAAGMMFGLCRALPLKICGKIATILASDTVSHMGVRLNQNIPSRVEEILRNVVNT